MRVLLGMSGGLDSTYSVHELKSLGHEVEGAILKMHGFTDVSAAVLSAEKMGVKLHVIDCSKEFEDIVTKNFICEYQNGRTPNPCTVCNRQVKFKVLCDFARKNGFDKVATGHYAGTELTDSGRYCVTKAADTSKDQSYMLWNLTQEQLSMVLFPMSKMNKSIVREVAHQMEIEAADRPESMDICFLPGGNYAEFIRSRTGNFEEGNFVDRDGKILGRHKGIVNYTVGQRKGLGISLGQRMFVSEINSADNTVTLMPEEDVYMTGMLVGMLNFQAMPEPSSGETLNARLRGKTRYSSRTDEMDVQIFGEKAYEGYGCGSYARVKFLNPVRAITPGQSAVFYDGDRIAFGGVILKSEFADSKR